MKLFQLIIKDIKNVLYDVKTLGVLILMPIIIMSILGFSLKDMFYQESGTNVEAIEIAIVKNYDFDQDIVAFKEFSEKQINTKYTFSVENIEENNLETILFNDFLDNEELDEMFNYTIVEEDEYGKMIDEDLIVAAVILPEKFIYDGLISFQTMARNEIEIEIITNPSYSIKTLYVTGVFDAFSSNLNLGVARMKTLGAKMSVNGLLDQMDMVIQNQEEIKAVETTVNQVFKDKKETISSFQYYAAAIMAMFLLYAASFGGKAILSEREEYTLARLSSMGIKLNRIVFSNFVRIMLLAMVQSLIMVLFSSVVLGVKWGNIGTLVFGIFIVSAVVAGFGLVMSIITLSSGKYSVANIFEFVIIQFMALIGGSFIPVEVLPEAISNINFLSVSGLAIKIFVNGMYNQPLSASSNELIILGIYIVALVGISLIMLRIIRKKVNVC